jgi:hypothetical protein
MAVCALSRNSLSLSLPCPTLNTSLSICSHHQIRADGSVRAFAQLTLSRFLAPISTHLFLSALITRYVQMAVCAPSRNSLSLACLPHSEHISFYLLSSPATCRWQCARLRAAHTHTLSLTPLSTHLFRSALITSYVQMAVCAPSRNSFMTGRRPDTTRCWNFDSNFRSAAINGSTWTTMPGYFVHHHFLTISSGKLYHDGPPG